MFIPIQDRELDAAFDRLCAAQPSPLKRTPMGESIIRRVVAAYEATGDPLVWMQIGPANSDDKTPAGSA